MRTLLAIVALAWLVVCIPVASAHAYVVQSVPESGERIEAFPSAVGIIYTEGIQRGEAVVLDEAGERVDEGRFDVNAGDRRITSVPLRETGGEGVYVLQWRVLSVDTHVTSGSLYFLVGNATPTRETILETHGSSAHHSGLAWTKSAEKGVLLVSLALLLGVPITAGLVARPLLYPMGFAATETTRMRRVLLVAAAVGLVASALLVLPGIAEITGWAASALAHALVTTDSGRLLLFHAVSLGGAILVLAFPSKPRVFLPAAAVAALVSQAGVSWLSHSGSFVGMTIGAGADLLHLIGAALWFGGLVALVVLVLPSLRQKPTPGRSGAHFIRRFSLLALAGLTMAVAAGLLMASWFVPEPESVTTSAYGISFGLKLTLLGGALAAAAANRLFWTQRMEKEPDGGRKALRGFQRTLTVEVVCLVGVLLLSGFMTSNSTAVAATHEGAAEFHEEEATLGSAHATLSVVPLTVGFNAIDVRLERDGEPWSGPDNVTVLLRHVERGIELPSIILNREAPGHYGAVAVLAFPGNWSLRYSYFIPGEGFFAQPTTLELPSGAVDHSEHAVATISEGSLRLPFAIGAALAAVGGVGAIGVETILLRREKDARARPRHHAAKRPKTRRRSP